MDIKSKKGVTLVEVVVAVTIMAIIIVPISLVFTTAYTNFIRESDKVAAQQGARDVLYGKGINSYGVMGDLERSDAASSEIVIGDGSSTTASSISIPVKDIVTRKLIDTKIYRFNGSELFYSDTGSSNDYFYIETLPDGTEIKKTSSNDRKIEVKNFVVERKAKGTDIDTDMIKITVTVTCGQSGDVTLESSYRIPDIEQ